MQDINQRHERLLSENFYYPAKVTLKNPVLN